MSIVILTEIKNSMDHDDMIKVIHDMCNYRNTTIEANGESNDAKVPNEEAKRFYQ